MRKFLTPFIIIALLIPVAMPTVLVHAQTDDERIEQLRQQIAALEQQAGQYRSNIASEQVKRKTLQGEINIIKNQIGNLETQIQLTSTKIDKTKLEIGGLEGDIYDTQANMDKQRETIGRLLVFLNRQDGEPLLATLIKNQNISDFFRQREYLNNVNTQLLVLIDDLEKSKKELEGQKNTLEGKQEELEQLKDESQSKKSSLASVKSSKDTLLTQTKGQEAQYQKMLTDIEKREAAFFNELRTLESKVVQGGLYLVHITATNVPPRGTKIFKYPETGYHVTQGYGMTAYAKKGAYGGAPHNGLDLAAGYGSPIMSIGDGEIVANGSNDGWGNWVAIKHPNNMVSIYGHMSALSPLKVGSAVKVGQVIGYEGATGNVTGSHVHLSLYREFFTYVNEKKNQLYFNYFEGSVNPLDYIQ